MEGDLHGIDRFASSNIPTLIWMSQKVVCWQAGVFRYPTGLSCSYLQSQSIVLFTLFEAVVIVIVIVSFRALLNHNQLHDSYIYDYFTIISGLFF